MSKNDLLKKITQIDLDHWAGTTILSRGMDYQRNAHVTKLLEIKEGGLIAWVAGSKDYLTRIRIEETKLHSECSCPYYDTCKHAVAVVLEYLEQVKSNREIASITQEDVELMYKNPPANLELNYSIETLKSYLQTQTQEELVRLIIDLSENNATTYKMLQNHYRLTTQDKDQIIQSIRSDISEMLKSNYGDYDDYRHYNEVESDFAELQQRLERLVAQNRVDEVIDLAEELLEAGKHVVEMEEEGESSYDIANCLGLIFQALPQSSLPTIEQMLWMIDIEQKDDYDLCSKSDVFWRQDFKQADWSQFADVLVKRIDNALNDEEKFSNGHYQHTYYIKKIVFALRKAERTTEIASFYQQQISYGYDGYIELIDFLKEIGQIDEAIAWIKKGIENTQGESRYGVNQLHDRFKDIQELNENWAQVAALEADNFFCDPSLKTYLNLQKACQHTEMDVSFIKKSALHFLETGDMSFKNDEKWQFPEPFFKKEVERTYFFPVPRILMDIAIHEKRENDVVHLYEKYKDSFHYKDKIAEAILDTHTDKAIQIWKEIAETYINQVKKKSYQLSAVYLAKIRDVLRKSGKESEWQTYKQDLHQRNRRRSSFTGILAKI